MRILCINLQTDKHPSCAEAFLCLSPRVHYRAPHFIFVDIASTSLLLGGERQVLEHAFELALKISPFAQVAIADSAPAAQIFATYHQKYLSHAGASTNEIASFTLSSLLHFEGLLPWPSEREVEAMLSLFQLIGLRTLGDLKNLKLESLRERFGELGTTLWKRVHSVEKQTVSPLLSQEPLVAYSYFDDPVDLVPILFHKLKPSVEFLFLRLEGLSRFAERLTLRLFCEYSGQRQEFHIEAAGPSRNTELFLTLIERRLESVSLENPIREFEIEIFDCPEKVTQLDFFEPRDRNEDQWQKLVSILGQHEVNMGFLQTEAHYMPEDSFSLVKKFPHLHQPQDQISIIDEALQVKRAYGKALNAAPRPSLLLEKPEPLANGKMKDYKFLTSIPTERIEAAWWDEAEERDYYLAASYCGALVWIFQDRMSGSYYLHGYYD
ncbi:MAG: hypothetical protein AB7O96_13450 [Pseudobdellovibrionaceae bacterium]